VPRLRRSLIFLDAIHAFTRAAIACRVFDAKHIPIVFQAEEGEDLEVPATWFISEHWPGPVVIDWKGGLERMRFALDLSEDAFYFAGF
jgi:hypothetical protein